MIWALYAFDASVASTGAAAEQADSEMNVLDALIKAGRFETFVMASQQAELADDLAADGPFTLFASTDYAFGSLSKDELDSLLAEPGGLQATLRHHVLAGKLTAYDLAQAGSATTELGTSLTFIQHGDELMVDGAIVERGQIEASNGVIYAINRVLEPPADLLASDEAAAPTPTDVVAAETTTITTVETVSDTQKSIPALQEDFMSGGSLLSGAGQLPVFALLLLLLTGGALAALRRQG